MLLAESTRLLSFWNENEALNEMRLKQLQLDVMRYQILLQLVFFDCFSCVHNHPDSE